MALERSPLDELTRLPLLCVPHEDTAFVLQGLRPNGGLFDWDHLYRPRLDPILTGTLGGQAIRHARVQLLHRTEQHEPKDENLDGPLLPATPDEQFQAAVFCAAGYIPRRALDFSTGKARTVALSDWQRKRLLTSGEVKVESIELIRQFLREFVLSQEVDGIQPSVVDEFLGLVPDTTGAQNRKLELAELLLGTFIDPPASRIAEVYHTCQIRGALAPDSPMSPGAFIGKQIVGYGRRSWLRLISSLEMTLRARREQRPRVATAAASPMAMPKMRPVGRIALMPWGGNLSTGNALA